MQAADDRLHALVELRILDLARDDLRAGEDAGVRLDREPDRHLPVGAPVTGEQLAVAVRERSLGRRHLLLHVAAEGRADDGRLAAGAGRTRIFIYPPYEFKVVDALLTNFHLPRSTLLMLASAFAAPKEVRGRERLLEAYAEAVRRQYRFFSYGDAMLLV